MINSTFAPIVFDRYSRSGDFSSIETCVAPASGTIPTLMLSAPRKGRAAATERAPAAEVRKSRRGGVITLSTIPIGNAAKITTSLHEAWWRALAQGARN